MKVKKFLDSAQTDIVAEDKIMKEGDWLLKWSPNSKGTSTGYELFTPVSFDPQKTGGPLGGLVLAAVFYMIENGPSGFAEELVRRANDLSRQMGDDRRVLSDIPKNKTIN